MGYGYSYGSYGAGSVAVWQWALILIPFVLCLGAQFLVKHNYKKYSNIGNRRGLSGAQAAQLLLASRGINNVRVERVAGNLTDNFDPRTNVIRLSEGVYDSTSIAAVGIACHEAGHACQYAENYVPMKIRAKVIPAANIGSMIGIPLCIISLIFSLQPLFYIGIILYGAVFIFQLATLPVEFNASARALKAIKGCDFLNENEYSGAKAVLQAAALTYVAAMATSLLTIIRLLLLNRRN